MESYNDATSYNVDGKIQPKIDAELETEFEKASIGIRIVAYAIDSWLLGLAILGPILFLLFGDFAPTGDIDRTITWFARTYPVYALITALVICLKDIVKGQSPGKYFLGLAVRSSYSISEIPSIPKLFFRNILSLFWLLELLVLALSSQKTKIGDKLTGTDVYRISRKTKVGAIVGSLILSIVIFIVFLFVWSMTPV